MFFFKFLDHVRYFSFNSYNNNNSNNNNNNSNNNNNNNVIIIIRITIIN